MRLFHVLALRLRSLLRSRQAHVDLEAELEFHLEEQVKENIARGMTRVEARDAARRAMGGMLLIQEQCRDMRGINWIENFVSDSRYTLRGLLKSPGFAAAVIASLALGIGANTAIFSAIDAVMLRTIPVARPAELVQVQQWLPEGRPNWAWAIFSYPDYKMFRDQNAVFADAAAISRRIASARIGSDAAAAKGAYISSNFYSLLGVQPFLGSFSSEPYTAVLCYGFWQRVYTSDPSVIGRTFVVDDKSYTIAGVAAPGFDGIDAGEPLDFTEPIEFSGSAAVSHAQFGPMSPWLQVIARLKPGVSLAQAAANLNVIYAPVLADFAQRAAANHMRPLIDWITVRSASRGISRVHDDYAHALVILIAITGAVLLIACVNVATLLLARAASRGREFGVRLCLGAGRARMISQMMTESLVLSVAGGIGGIVLARWSGAALAAILASGRQTVELNLRLDWRLLAFTVAITALVCVTVGIVPAVRATHANLAAATRGAANHSGILRAGFIAVQVGITLVLVAGAGLFLATLRNLETLDAGWRREHVVLADLQPGKAGYDGARQNEFYRALLERVRAESGVRSASLSLMGPMTGISLAVGLQIDGYAPRPGENMTVSMNQVSGGFFETLATPILAGRDFNSHDGDPATPRVLINEAVVRRYFAETNPLGRMISFRSNALHHAEIIGVVKDAKYANMRAGAPPTIYSNLLATDSRANEAWLEVYGGNDARAATAIRQSVNALNPAVPVAQLTTFDRQIQATLVSERLMALITTIFGALALLMAAIGLYGVLAYAVARRTREIGIRMALGAQRRRVIRMVIGEVAATVGVGIAVGICASLALGQFVASMLYQVQPHDPWALAFGAAMLCATSALAAYLPARRASRVDPMVALRHE